MRFDPLDVRFDEVYGILLFQLSPEWQLELNDILQRWKESVSGGGGSDIYTIKTFYATRNAKRRDHT